MLTVSLIIIPNGCNAVRFRRRPLRGWHFAFFRLRKCFLRKLRYEQKLDILIRTGLISNYINKKAHICTLTSRCEFSYILGKTTFVELSFSIFILYKFLKNVNLKFTIRHSLLVIHYNFVIKTLRKQGFYYKIVTKSLLP